MISLNDGIQMPKLAVAPFRMDSNEETAEMVKCMVANGIRHFHIAELFGNGHILVQALVEAGLSREDVFITLKLWPKDRTAVDVLESFKNTLDFVGLKYVDLLMVHSPIDLANRVDQWKAIESLKVENLTKSIGIANITTEQLADVLKNCSITPSVFEVEITPFDPKPNVTDFCEDSSLVMMAMAPLVKGMKNKDPTLLSIAGQLQIPVEQVLVRWNLTKGFAVALPVNVNVLVDASALLEPLSAEDMEAMSILDINFKSTWVPTEESDE